jgi:hypothetical protein
MTEQDRKMPLDDVTCIGCGKLDYYCGCMTCWTPRKIEGLRTEYLKQLVRDDFQGLLSDGDSRVLAAIKAELERRTPPFISYRQ